ncbi:NTP transferase domain-containing protein [Jannaschia sp. LMIT008]|uniref:nucleotidyltransferase family protein n=1 Tax=Jannaschia maritima TaxID=3032585 RepID=UPI0028111A43|nr:NTP transferase domain-containing protein [Jannaschia sp. LMIT008]
MPDRPDPAIVILAAGRSSRMRGADKLLEDVGGTPLILRAVRAACAAVAEVIVVLPATDRTRRSWLTDTPARIVDVADGGMSASIAAGIAACRGEAAMLHLADMPEIDATALGLVAAAWRTGDGPVLRAATSDGRPGHPVVFDRSLFPDLSALAGDGGARAVVARHGGAIVRLPGTAALVDLDTPEDWAAWRRTFSIS